MSAIEKIEVHLDGIGHVLADRMLAVPVHQRTYAWTSEQVDDLFKDISDAIRQNFEEYFLGTLVLTQGESGRQMVIDGQQRLATICILIGAIRDYFELQGDTERANEIKKKYLSERTIRTLAETPHLVLDEVDNEFFISNVLTYTNDPRRKAEPLVPSHERIAGAITQAKQLVNNIKAISHSPDEILLNLLDYLHDNTKVILVEVANEANAFTIFEVLNDRGLDLSVSDLLKNYIFSKSQDRISEAKESWIGLLSHLESVGGDKQVKDFITEVLQSKMDGV